ncbi:Alpha/beta hydrolase fold-containing protein [Desulfonema limicola]|uniref:Alpha/beta hydrolase fold-containing protein n=1 Tax=Desulfonema limicola TaxID=45656 RepID=A0A975GHY4_9BACT|nr:alpha/beta hydrolase [Desulfonema limicola]QTA81839.1 Alpha/beta hydrolase fold-containing protein [Desulfonema limicola]
MSKLNITGNKIFYIQAADCNLRVKSIKPDNLKNNLPPLIFLHEGLGCIEMWKDFPEKLCNVLGAYGLIYERKGYGKMADRFGRKWPYDYLVKEATIYLPAFLKACNIKNAILVGHSDGGSIALIGAAERGDMIHSIITEAAHVFVEDITTLGIKEVVDSYENKNLKEKLARYHGKNTDTIFYRWAETWLDPEYRQWNIESFMPKITCPLLVLQGEDDEYATSAQVQKIKNQVSGPVKTELVPNCGHIPHFQAGEKVLEIMKDFILKNNSTPNLLRH